jgi:hypothetical protein
MINQIEETGDKSITPIDVSRKIVKLMVLRSNLYEKLNQVKDEIGYLKGTLVDEMKKLDVLTLKTGEYLIVRKKSLTIKVIDKLALEKDLEKWDVEIVKTLDLLAMKSTIDRLVKDGNKLDGCMVNDSDSVTITINKKKEVKDEKALSS